MSVSTVKNAAARLLAVVMAAVLALGMAPGLDFAGGGSHLTASASEQEAAAPLPAGTLAGSSQDSQDEGDGASDGVVVASGDEGQAPEADLQSADTAAADSAGSATGTTIKIAVYRSSYPLVWDLNDEGSSDVTKAQWDKPASWPKEGSPGSAVGAYAGYTEADEPTRTGFAFLGWSAVADDPTVAGKLDTLEIPKGTEPVEGADGVKSITLHALWAPIEYSVVFDLTKNPEDASAVPSFRWEGLKGTFSDLGGGRYRLSGVTLEDYDPERGLIEIATPSRGTGGYRFLSWAEPESQQSPTVAMRPAGTSTWYVNPVALTHYDYEPVLTARWSLSFDVDVPSQITFDEYDSLEIEGNLTDTTDEDVVDEESPDKHDAGKMAHFCSQSTAVDYKIVALKSEMQAAASDILTTSDSAKATQEQVLSDEKLLSLFAANNASESAGVHFRLTDTIDMDDSSRYGAFVIPKQTKDYSDADYSRDDEERLYVSYRLNLSNRVDGASEPNHGLVTPSNVNEGDRTPIAKVSYEFAVADHDTEKAPIGDGLYIDDGGTFYGLDYIKRAAEDLSANGTASRYYSQFKGWLDAQVMTNGNPGPGPYFQLKVEGAAADDGCLPVQLIGICQDTKSDGTGKAGLTFQMRDVYALRQLTCQDAGSTFFVNAMNSTGSNVGGWGESELKRQLQGTFLSKLDPGMQTAIARIDKYQQIAYTATDYVGAGLLQKTSGESVWLPSLHEVMGRTFDFNNESEGLTINGYMPFQYEAFRTEGTSTVNTKAIKSFNGGICDWWLRSFGRDIGGGICCAHFDGSILGHPPHDYSVGVVPAFCL